MKFHVLALLVFIPLASSLPLKLGKTVLGTAALLSSADLPSANAYSALSAKLWHNPAPSSTSLVEQEPWNDTNQYLNTLEKIIGRTHYVPSNEWGVTTPISMEYSW
jgi:hypothetical protein